MFAINKKLQKKWVFHKLYFLDLSAHGIFAVFISRT